MCVCVCAVAEILETLAFVANASNLVLYLIKCMHMSPSRSANIVTNFIGTAFLLALLGGFCSDAFFSTYQTFLISAVFELLVCTISTITIVFKLLFAFFLQNSLVFETFQKQKFLHLSLFTCFLFFWIGWVVTNFLICLSSHSHHQYPFPLFYMIWKVNIIFIVWVIF